MTDNNSKDNLLEHNRDITNQPIEITDSEIKNNVMVALPPAVKKKYIENIPSDVIEHIKVLHKDVDTGFIFLDNLYRDMEVLDTGTHGRHTLDIMGVVKLSSYMTYIKLGYSKPNAYRKAYTIASGINIDGKEVDKKVKGLESSKAFIIAQKLNMIPAHIQFVGVYNKAIETLYNLMIDEKSGQRTRLESAVALMTHLKQPEPTKFELAVTHTGNGEELDAMQNAVDTLIAMQLAKLNSGDITLTEVIATDISIKEGNNE